MVDVFLAGLVGGLAATVVMSLLMAPMMRGQPGPAAMLASKLNGRPPGDNATLGYALHLAYGLAAGVLLAWGLDAYAGIASWTLLGLAGAGILFGVALWLLGALFWAPVSGMDRRLAGMSREGTIRLQSAMLGLHLVYGLVLAGALWLLRPTSAAPRLTDNALWGALALLGLLVLAGQWVHLQHRERSRERRRERRGRPA